MKTTHAATALAVGAASAMPQGGPPNGYGPFGGSAAPSDYSSISGALASWTSAAGITAWPTATADWESLTSQYTLPTELSSAASWWSSNGFPQVTGAPGNGGYGPYGGGPNGMGGGPGGWKGGNGMGPFGPGRGGDANGWGPWGQSGEWTEGPWTSWWGTGACPASTWSGIFTHIHTPTPHHT